MARSRAASLVLAALVIGAGPAGCLLPNRGTPIFVDGFAGDFWSGKGLLLEVSPDQKQCLVAARDTALIVRERWVACTSVHPRRG